MQHFTPVSGLIGGLLIGLAASLLVLLNGQVAGISGILAGILRRPAGDIVWRYLFLIGLVAAPFAVTAIAGSPVAVVAQASPFWLALAGLLVGFGSRLGGGCTSGHGICGIARGSPRSLIATSVFFAVALLTVYAARHASAG